MSELASTVLAFEAFPDCKLHLLLFENVSNASSIKQQIVSKQTPVDAAFLDADLVPSTLVTHLAAYKALAAQVPLSSCSGPVCACSALQFKVFLRGCFAWLSSCARMSYNAKRAVSNCMVAVHQQLKCLKHQRCRCATTALMRLCTDECSSCPKRAGS